MHFIHRVDSQLFTMVDHNDYYSNYWWINGKGDWLKITLIAAPLMIVFGLVLITHRICSRQSPARIYKPCLHLYSPPYDPVYVPTTCAFDDTRYDVNKQHGEHVIDAKDASVIRSCGKG